MATTARRSLLWFQHEDGARRGVSPSRRTPYYGDIKQRAAALGHNPGHVVIFTGASPVVASTDGEAARLLTWTARSPTSGTWGVHFRTSDIKGLTKACAWPAGRWAA
ncbi:MAG: FMN-dependent oxidoreductase, nitrilotriacetate monooxygenase family [Actinomycetia bacterium]|nr:FMN-dependent oxidoreductase, nitrilotriacetate monooxygenase family [Actinomycetes bacterium]